MFLVHVLLLISVPMFMLSGLMGLFSVRKKQWNTQQFKKAFEMALIFWFCLSCIWWLWVFWLLKLYSVPLTTWMSHFLVVA